jgi:hypothetical protein
MIESLLLETHCGSCGSSTLAQVPQLPQPSGLRCGCVATTPVGVAITPALPQAGKSAPNGYSHSRVGLTMVYWKG